MTLLSYRPFIAVAMYARLYSHYYYKMPELNSVLESVLDYKTRRLEELLDIYVNHTSLARAVITILPLYMYMYGYGCLFDLLKKDPTIHIIRNPVASEVFTHAADGVEEINLLLTNGIRRGTNHFLAGPTFLLFKIENSLDEISLLYRERGLTPETASEIIGYIKEIYALHNALRTEFTVVRKVLLNAEVRDKVLQSYDCLESSPLI